MNTHESARNTILFFFLARGEQKTTRGQILPLMFRGGRNPLSSPAVVLRRIPSYDPEHVPCEGNPHKIVRTCVLRSTRP